MSSTTSTLEPVENDLSVEYDGNGKQSLVVVDGESVAAVIALDQDVGEDEAADLVDSIEAEVAHAVEGVRKARSGFGLTKTGP